MLLKKLQWHQKNQQHLPYHFMITITGFLDWILSFLYIKGKQFIVLWTIYYWKWHEIFKRFFSMFSCAVIRHYDKSNLERKGFIHLKPSGPKKSPWSSNWRRYLGGALLPHVCLPQSLSSTTQDKWGSWTLFFLQFSFNNFLHTHRK